MPPSVEDRRPPITPQLAVRVAVLGGVAFVAFAIIFFRLWFLQVLTGDDYVSQARDNRVRKIKIEAPRGNIIDRNGKTLVKTRAAPVVQILPTQVPEAELEVADQYRKALALVEGRRLAAEQDLRSLERRLAADGRKSTKAEKRRRITLAKSASKAERVRVAPIPAGEPQLRALYRRLGRVIEMRPVAIHRRVVQGIADQPSANVTIKTDVPPPAFNYLLEHREAFPGVVVEKKYLRNYPYQDARGPAVRDAARDLAGRAEGEAVPRRRRRHADRQGRDRGDLRQVPARDRRLHARDRQLARQPRRHAAHDARRPDPGPPAPADARPRAAARAPETRSRAAVAAASGNGADAGAYVAMDPRDGEVLALGSYPSFDANLFAKPIDQRTYDQLNSEDNGAPLFNRAIAAGVSDRLDVQADHGVRGARRRDHHAEHRRSNDGGDVQVGDREFQNARDASFGPLGAPARAPGLLGRLLLQARRGRPTTAARSSRTGRASSGFGQPTGIDMPGEFGGLVPDGKWRNEGYDDVPQVREEGARRRPAPGGAVRVRRHRAPVVQRRQRQPRRRPGRPAGDAAAARDRLLGDRQRRHASCARTSACRSRTAPGASRGDPQAGRARTSSSPPPTAQAIMRRPARRRRRSRRHVGRRVRRASRYPVYGKTGTAERGAEPDQSWYACYVADPVAADRRRRDGREGRLRRRDRGAGGAPDPRRSGSASGRRVPRGSECHPMSRVPRYRERAA